MSIMTESQIKSLAVAIADQLHIHNSNLLTEEAYFLHTLDDAIEEAILDTIAFNKVVHDVLTEVEHRNPQGYNIFGTLPTLRLLNKS